MNKDDFNKLEIMDQLNYLNKELQNNMTLTDICKNIGIARSTVGGRMKKQGYILDKELNQYIQNEEENIGRETCKLTVSKQLTNSRPSKIEEKNIETKNENPTEETPVSNQLTDCKQGENSLALNTNDSNNLSYLLQNMDTLRSLIEANKNNNSAINEMNNLDDIINDIYKFKQEKRDFSKVKSLRIDPSIHSDFEEIAKELLDKGINQQEFLNYVLKSFIDFYNDMKRS